MYLPLIIAAVLAFGVSLLPQKARAAVVIPDQFIAKMFTEALGRAPTPSNWSVYSNHFSVVGCSATTLKDVGSGFYTSPEFASRNYDNASRVLSLYRGVLSREPDQGGFDASYNALQNGTLTWNTVVTNFFSTAEFNALSTSICTGNPYGWRATAVLNLPVANTNNFGGAARNQTQANLQSALNAKASTCGTVLLEQKAVVRLTSNLTIPACVTLATVGNPGPGEYAKMGRLIRTADIPTAYLITLQPGAKLTSTWVDGQHSNITMPATSSRDSNISTVGSNGQITYNRVSDGQGTQIFTNGARSNLGTCSGLVISNNLITGYANRHTSSDMYSITDGITNQCESATIENNAIVDVTDVGIILFSPSDLSSNPQRSTVRYNTILNAGNSAFAALALDPMTGVRQDNCTFGAPRPPVNYFTGTQVTNNTLWTGSQAHFDIAISVGTQAWFCLNYGIGGTVSNNTTSSQKVNVKIGILVADMEQVTVQGNWLDIRGFITVNSCPSGGVLVASNTTGSVIQPFTTVAKSAVTKCIAH